MEGAIFGAVLNSTLPWLYKAIDERRKKWGKWRGRRKLKPHVDSLQFELELIQAAIRDRRKKNSKDTSYLQRACIAQQRRLAYDIEDCIDQFRANKIKGEELGTMITQLNEQAVKLHDQLVSCTGKEPEGTSSSSAHGPCSPAPARRDDNVVVVGMEEPINELKALLSESGRLSERKLTVIFIVGFGGIGKTFLAEHVYREQRDCFPRSAFVRTAGMDENKILDEIVNELHRQDVQMGKGLHGANTPMDVAHVRKEALEKEFKKLHRQATNHCQQETLQVGINGVHSDPSAPGQQRAHQVGSCPTYEQQLLPKEGVEEKEGKIEEIVENEEEAAAAYTIANNAFSENMCESRKRLKSSLRTNRFLIVIDDVRTEELVQNIISALPQGEKVDSRVIVTTSIQKVADCNLNSFHRHVYKMEPLDKKNSEDLFFKVACRNGSPSKAEEKQYFKFRDYCDGVPLALVSLAQYCNGDLSRCAEAWGKLCNLEKDCLLETMQKVVEHSFYNLSTLVLQDCLLYFCMFPWGHQIRRDALIRRWLAEGLVLPEDEGDSISPVDAAVKNLKTLVDQYVIRPTKISINGEVKTCQPLGVMHGYITSKSRSENFILLSCGDKTPNPIRRLSLHHTGDGDNVRALEKDLSRLRTLAVFNKGEEDPLSFAKCELLRVLDLEACPGLNKGHLDEICKLLRLLKYLSLGVGGITKVPRKIAMLECLETLQVAKEEVVVVPASVLKLPHLKHLLGKLKLREGFRFRGKKDLEEFLSKKSMLETLAGFVVDKSPGFPQLMCRMRSLRKVKIWCNPDASSTNQTDLSQSIGKFLSGAKSTPGVRRSLSVDFYGCSGQFLNFATAPAILPHENLPGGLSSLKLRGMLSPVPAFVTNLCGITELCLSSSTLRWNEIVVGVSKLEILEYLKLVSDTNIEGEVIIECGQFVSLKRLCLVAKESVSQMTIHAEALKHLVSLQLICLGLDGHSADQIQSLNKLRELTLHAGVAQANWKEAARKHPNRPSVVFISPSTTRASAHASTLL